MGADKTVDLSAIYPVQHLMRNKLSSGDLGGFRGVSATINFGARKGIEHSYVKILNFLVLLTLLYSMQTYNISNLSLILNLQHSNETYRLIKRTRHDYKTVTVVPRNVVFSRSCIIALLIIDFSFRAVELIILSGDVHPNPGPNSVNSSGQGSEINLSNDSLQELLACHLSIFHLNIQSLRPKIDLLRAESEAYDIAVFSESWLKPDITDDEVLLDHFLSPFRSDKTGRPGGGVVIYVRDSISCKRRSDLEVLGLEAVWVEVNVKSKNILIGGSTDHLTVMQNTST